jgi:hypothetical protein
MYKRMGSRGYITFAVLIAAIFWMAESLIHFFIDGGQWLKVTPADFEVIPVDFYELCERTLIVILIIAVLVFISITAQQCGMQRRMKERGDIRPLSM